MSCFDSATALASTIESDRRTSEIFVFRKMRSYCHSQMSQTYMDLFIDDHYLYILA